MLPSLVGAAGEAVKDRARGEAFFVEEPEGVVPGVARVDHQRPVHRFGKLDVTPERDLLLVAGRVLVVKVEPGFTDRDAAFGLGQRGECVPLGVEFRRVVRMQTDGRVHVVVLRREIQRLLRRLEAGTHAHHPLDARVAHA